MFKRIFTFLALAFALLGTQCWAVPKTALQCEETCPPSFPNTFSPGNTEGVYDFTATGDGKLIVDFATVLTTFTLTVTVSHPTDPLPLDPNVFPSGTVCVKYPGKDSQCDQYDFTGSAGGPNGVPVKNKDYKGLITLRLSYSTFQTVHNPAFGHAPGDITTFTEDILTGYFQEAEDPVMIGKVPGLSSVVALDEPLEETDCFMFVSPNNFQTFTAGQEIEVEFQLFDSTTCAGNPIRDKDARLSFFTFDSNGQPVLVPVGKDEGGKHFHFDPHEGTNEREVDTEGLQPGTYYITVFSDEFSPQTREVIIQ